VKKDHLLLRRLQRICVVALALGQVAPLPLAAQTAPAPAPSITTGQSRADLRGRVVESVRILGNTTVSTPVILNLVRTRDGDRYDPETVQEDYQRIYGLKKFSNVEARVEPTDGGSVIVTFVVTEQSQVKGIRYQGNKVIDLETIKGVVDVREGESIDRFRLALAKQAIQNLYKDRNYAFAHVDVDADALAKNGEVVFTITEGPNVRIRKVNFVGAKSFTQSRLKDQVQSKYWIFIFRHGTYDPDTVEDDVAALRKYYEDHGFFDAKIGRKLIWSPDMSELQIDFIIDEGARYTIDSVEFRGNATVPATELSKNLKLLAGETFDAAVLQRDVREVIRAYSPYGFIYQPGSNDPDFLTIGRPGNPYTVDTVFLRDAKKVRLVYSISEGKPFQLGRIITKGNNKTQDKVILREMHMAPGQLYNSGEVQDAVERLRGTPFFTRVSATPTGNDPVYRDLLVEVEEGKTASFNIGAGINSNGGVGGNITYEQRNFDIMNWPSSFRDFLSERAFVGAGQTLRISLEPGTTATNASIRFTEPWIFDQPYSFTGELYLRNRIREHYDDERLGGRVSLGKRFNNVWSASVTLRAENVDITHIEDKEIRAEEILDAEGNSGLTSAALRVSRDTTTRGLLPARGMTTTAGYEQYGALGGDYTFGKITMAHDQYFTLHEDLLDRKVILAFHGDAGYIVGDSVFFERFYGGGIGSIRGFAFRGVSPRSGPDDDRIGGDFMLTGTAEVSFPIAGEELRGVVFADVGTVEPDFELGTIRSSIGAGIRLTLPILGQTPIALDFAIPITKDRDDDTQFFSFSLGFTP
jgi:outer membrane protein insertion porin family